MRVYLILLATLCVLSITLSEANAKTNTKQKDVKNKYGKETTKKASKDAETENQEVQEEKPAFEKARIRYTKPKTDTRAKEETQTKAKKQDVKYSTGKKTKTADVERVAKNKYKQTPQDQAPKTKKLKKQEKPTKSVYTNEELQENTVPEPKTKDKRTKRDTTKIVEKEKLKKIQREEAGVEEQSVEVCPPCDCSKKVRNLDQYLSNNAEEDETTVETETDEQTQEEETDENLQCDSLVEGCDV